MAPVVVSSVVVHPLVLLSTVDHYNRVAKDTKKRVVGVLLGETQKGVVDVTNSYAVPFEEDDKDSTVWFLDHNFHENMFAMFKKVQARENVVGWYSTGPRIRAADLGIHELFRKYCPNPAYVIIDVNPAAQPEIPTKAYVSVELEKESAEGEGKRTFQHIPSTVGALDAEEVGVEHLLRDVKDMSVSTLTTQINAKLLSLRSLLSHLGETNQYLANVSSGRLPANHAIINNLQDIFNLAPNLNVAELSKAFNVKSNDMHLVVYLSAVIRSVVALHNLILNKQSLRDEESKEAEPAAAAAAGKEGEKTAAGGADAAKKADEKKDSASKE